MANSIFDKDAVLILGAGVSQPFDLPLGGQLIEQIAKSLNKERNLLFRTELNPTPLQRLFNGLGSRAKAFLELPIYFTVLYPYLDPANHNVTDEKKLNAEIDRLERLENLLTDQTSETIDDFIIMNESYADLAKICVAVEIFKKCYDLEKGIKVRAFEQRHLRKKIYRYETNDYVFNKERNWTHSLINIIRQGINNDLVTGKNKVKIITFNYDTILEHVLDLQFDNTERAYGDWSTYIDILHVHGQFGDLRSTKDTPAEICRNWAEGIYVVQEGGVSVTPKISLARAVAKTLVINARQIYACGFAFARPNCRLIGLSESKLKDGVRHITFCNYDGNVGMSKYLKGFETPKNAASLMNTFVEEESGTPDKPLGVNDWLNLGYLGETPA